MSCYKVCQYSGLNSAYVSRLKAGQKANPSVRTIVKIGLALVHHNRGITLGDIDELFKTGGYVF